MRTSLIALAIGASLVGLTGCGEKKEQPEFVSSTLRQMASNTMTTSHPITATGSTQQQTLNTPHAPQTPPDGILIDHNRIVIDLNQTKNFFEGLAKKVDQNLRKIEKDLQKQPLQPPNVPGVVVTPDRIEIDLNKTEKFMENWIKSVESVGREFDKAMRELEKSIQP